MTGGRTRTPSGRYSLASIDGVLDVKVIDKFAKYFFRNLIWASNGNEVDTVMARGRLVKVDGQIMPFLDGTTPEMIISAVNRLSEAFAEYRKTAPELKGTGAHQ